MSSLTELLSHKWFTYFLTNLRQLNRLINSFKISYNKLKDHADLKDLLILETLKNSATKSYLQILKGEILHYDEIMHIATDSHAKGWKIDLEDKYEKEGELKWALDNALSFLVKRSVPSSVRAFSNGYDLMYFNFNNENINIVDLYDIIEGDSQIVIEKFNQWILQDGAERTELLQLLTLYIENNVTKTYEKIIPILLELSDTKFASTVFENSYIPNPTAVNFEFNNVKKYLINVLHLLHRNKDKNPSRVIDWTSNIVEFVIDIQNQLGKLKQENDQINDDSISRFVRENIQLIENNYIESIDRLDVSNYSLEGKITLFTRCIVGSKDRDLIISEKCRSILMKEVFVEFNLENLILYIQNYFFFESLYTHTCSKSAISDSGLLEIYNHNLQSNNSYLKLLWDSSYQELRNLSEIKERIKHDILYEVDLFISYIYYILTGVWGNVPILPKNQDKNFDFAPHPQTLDVIRKKEITKLSKIFNKISEESLIYVQTCSMLAKYNLENKDYKETVKYCDLVMKSSTISSSISESIFKSSKGPIIGFNLNEYPNVINESFTFFCKKEDFIHVISYAEILLMASEANFYLKSKENALKHINDVRARNEKEAISKVEDNFIALLLKEWKENLGAEGSYFFALKRNKKALDELNIESYQLFLPIPMEELMLNPNISQNEGYY